jgi:protein XagA
VDISLSAMHSTARATLLVTLLLASPPASALAFTKPAGQGITIFTTHYYLAEDGFGTNLSASTTPFPDNGRFSKVAESLWLEYGITDDLNLTVQADYQWVRFRDDSSSFSNIGLGDPEIGLKYRFHAARNPGDTTWSLRGMVKIPFDQSGEPGTGAHQTDVELLLMMARDSTLFAHPISVGFSAGYRWRAEGPADEIRAKYTVVSGFGGHWLFIGDVSGIFGLRNHDSTLATTNPELAPDFDRVTLQPSLARKLGDRIWLQGLAAYDVLGRNTGQGKELKLSLWFTF